MSKLPLERTDAPGIYRRGSRYWWSTASRVVSASSTPARWPRLRPSRSSATARRGHCAGPTLLVNFALTYVDREVRVRDLDRAEVQQFVDRLTTRPGRTGRLCDRSISNALTPLRLALDAAVAQRLVDANPAEQVVLPRQRAVAHGRRASGAF